MEFIQTMQKANTTTLTLLIWFLLFPFENKAQVQQGIIQGKIIDAENRLPIEGASVSLVGTSIGTATASNGVFELRNVGVGTYVVAITYIGYQELRIDDVVVFPSKITDLEVALEPAGELMEEVVISATVNKESNIALLADRKRSTMVIQKVGSQELSRKGIGNVGEGIAKVVGVAMVGNKSLFVRGLGDRYNNATLNGLPIPSTNPDLKLIPLDIFPTSIVKNIEVLKSYNSAYYGDFSGGTIDIVTKDYPEKAFIRAAVSSGFNSISTGKQFLGIDRGFASRLGFARADRAMPALPASVPVYDSYFNDNVDPQFKTPFVPHEYKAPVNAGLSLSGGDRISLDGGGTFGYLFTVANKNEYVFLPGSTAWFNAQQETIYNYDTEDYFYQTNTSGLLNLYYKPNAKATYGLTGLFVNDSRDGVLDNFGLNWDLGEVYGRRNTLIQNTLFTTQFNTKQQITERFSLDGAVGYTKTVGSIPDRTQTMVEARDNNQYQFSPNGITDVHRFFADLDDHDASARLAAELRFRNSEIGLTSLTFGVDGRYKKRRFDARQIDADAKNIRSLFRLDELDEVLSPQRLGFGDATSWRYKEVPNEQNRYRSEMYVYAPYANANFLWADKWNLVAGVRFESSSQSTDYKLERDVIEAPYRNNTITGNELLPAVSLKYMPTAKSNVIFAASKTISRPLFMEAAPFRYNESAGTAQRIGNPSLTNGDVYNVDLRYDYFPNPGELISVSVFGKRLIDPIEYVRVNSAEPMFSYVNSDRAVVAGVELEVNKNLGSLFASELDALRNASIGLNGSYLFSEVEFDEDKLSGKGVPFYPTNFKRPLFGASPYLVNADLTYRVNWNSRSHTQITGTYHVFGKRLFVAGAQGTGDIYEMPVNRLDAAINTVIMNKIGFDISINNILNPDIIYNQEFPTSDLEYMNVKRGVSVGATLSYTF